MAARYPDGVEEQHAARAPLLRGHASILSLMVLGGIVGAALTGVFGGGTSPVVRAESQKAAVTVKTPRRLRSGLFFETDITVTAKRPIADAVIALPPALWLDQTINSQVPAAEKEAFRDGTFRFHYGALAAGEQLRVKVDGQINPPLTVGTAGEVAVFDGERRLVALPLDITVLP